MQQHAGTSRNIETVNTYLDGFRKNDHEQIPVLPDRRYRVDRPRCLQSDRQGGLRQGDRRRARIHRPPELEVVRMVEEGDVIMAELMARRSAPRAGRCACPWQRCSLCATAGSLSAVLGDRTQGERLPLS